MERYSEYMSSCSSGSSIKSNTMINNINTPTINKENQVTDLRRLSSRIICSDNITRQNLNRRHNTSNINLIMDEDNDDDQFFTKMKLEIDKNLLQHSKENWEPQINYQNNNLLRKKRPILDAETQNVIKRFKRDTSHVHSIQSANNTKSIISCNSNNNTVENAPDTQRYIHEENIMQYENLPSPNIFNSRIPPRKYILQVTSTKHKNVLPMATNAATILHEEYEESLFYGMMCLTPPDGNSMEDNEDS